MVDKITEIITEVLELNSDTLANMNEHSDLVELGLDSLKAIEIVVNLEEEFDITVDEDDLLIENMSTITKLADLMEKYIA